MRIKKPKLGGGRGGKMSFPKGASALKARKGGTVKIPSIKAPKLSIGGRKSKRGDSLL